MAANVTGGPKFKMPRGASGEEVARIVEKGKARALETGASAGRVSSSARPVPVAEAHVPILAVDGVADGGVYLSKSTDGRGGEIEEEGSSARRGSTRCVGWIPASRKSFAS